MMSEYLKDLDSMRDYLIGTLIELGRSEAGATRQVADFEQAVRLRAIEETALTAQRRAQRQIQRQTKRGI